MATERCPLLLVVAAALVVGCEGFHVTSTARMGLMRWADRGSMRRVKANPLSIVASTAGGEAPITAAGRNSLENVLPQAHDGVLIVGGGPSGLGAALELDTIMNAELRDKWGDGVKITVVEKIQPVSSYDPNKGFMYLVSALGLQFCDRHGLSDSLATEGVDGSTLNGNRIGIDGSRSKFTFSFGKIRTPYWLPRDGFVSILEKAVRKRSVEVKEGWEVDIPKSVFCRGFT